MIHITRVSQLKEIEAIAALQQQNLKKNLPPELAAAEGFLTAEYSLDLLREMNAFSPAIIATNGEEVVGYALVATQAIRHQHPLLQHLFSGIDALEYNRRLLAESRYVVVGQLCVHQDFRGLGLVTKMYDHFAEVMNPDYEFMITDVADDNQRSLKAHRKAGFQVIHRMEYGGAHWNIVLRPLGGNTN